MTLHLPISVFLCCFLWQRELQVSLLRYTCETRLAAQQTPRRHAVYGPQAAACPAEAEVTHAATHIAACFVFFLSLFENTLAPFSRFKPVQKFDSCSGENYSGGGQHHPGAAEQTVIAQSQHHQQFLGQRSSDSEINKKTKKKKAVV